MQKSNALTEKQIEDVNESLSGTFIKNISVSAVSSKLMDIENMYYPKSVEPREMNQICSFIQSNFGYLTDRDITLAFIFHSKGVLGIDYTPKALSIDFCRNVLKTYGNMVYPLRVKREENVSTDKPTDESAWNIYFAHIQMYKSIPENPDWLSLYNHLVAIDKLQGECLTWSRENYKYAREKVQAYTNHVYGEHLTNPNVFKGEVKGRSTLGDKIKEAIGI